MPRPLLPVGGPPAARGRFPVLGALLAALLACACAAGPDAPNAAAAVGVPSGAQTATVERVIDGDTVWVRVDRPGGPLPTAAAHKVRLLGIDTPETRHPNSGPECWGPEASAFARRVLPPGATVHLVADREDTDRYGRFLRYLWTAGGLFYNEEAVRQGHARTLWIEPNHGYRDRLDAAESGARAAGRGLWGAACAAPSTGVAPGPAPGPEPGPSPEPEPGAPVAPAGCDPAYRGACVPPYPPDVDCPDLADTRFTAVSGDPHGLDGDNDGIACED